MISFFLFVFFIIPLFLFISFNLAKIVNLYDYPDEKRKIHLKPVLLVGGIFFEIIFLFFFTLFYYFKFENINEFLLYNLKDNIILLVTLSSIFIVGFLDDKKDLGPLIRLFLIFIIFYISLNFIGDIFIIQNLRSFFNYGLNLNTYSIFFTAFCFITLLNAINMADGINSLSSIIFSIWIFYLNLILPVDSFYFLINIILIYSLILFAFLNYQNKFFLGDSGCYVLVTYVCFLTAYAYNINSTSNLNYLNVESIFLLFMMPGLDMLRLFFKRIFKGKNPFKADNDHLHHILISHFGNFKTLIIYNLSIFIPWLMYYLFISLLPYLIISLLLIYCYLITLKKKKYEKT